MPLEFEITGAEDRTKELKIAVGGFAGAGKTMFASTAKDPLFVFFRQNPRIMSIANRAIPHVKLTNHVGAGGDLVQSVQDQLLHLLAWLMMAEEAKSVQTVVFDTADEMYQSLKEQRRLQNNGAFAVGDWGWLADTYREIMGAFIDLPYHLIANFHLKRTQEEDYTFREFAIQGASKDEAPGWFDVVGVLESYDGQRENGDRYTQRALLTRSNKHYPFLKDHAHALPDYFELSEDFVGDFPRLLEAVANPDLIPKNDRETIALYEGAMIDTVGMYTTEDGAKAPIPSPDELDSAKEERAAKVKEEKEKPSAADPEPVSEDQQEKPADEESAPTPSESEAETEPSDDPPISEAEAQARLEEELDAVVEEEAPTKEPGACTVCGETDISQDLLDLSLMRFPKEAPLCKEHFKEARAKMVSA
jgi:hypothetical protein